MASHHPDCLGSYDFERIAFYARRRFIEGCDTVSLMEQAASEREKEEIALVCLLDVSDEMVRAIELSCKYAEQCKVTDCRQRLRQMIEAEIALETCTDPLAD